MSLVVRRATLEDYEAYLPMAKNFLASTPMGKFVPFNEATFQKFFANAVENPEVAVWIAEYENKAIGGVGAAAYPMFFNPEYVFVQEIWWWLEPESRGKGAGKLMFQEIENWTKEKNAKAVVMCAFENEKIKKIETLYARQGFQPMERTFLKEVS